jgi:hypothetical protein
MKIVFYVGGEKSGPAERRINGGFDMHGCNQNNSINVYSSVLGWVGFESPDLLLQASFIPG